VGCGPLRSDWNDLRCACVAGLSECTARCSGGLGLSREKYLQIYKRVFAPRAPLYMLFGIIGILIATPIAMIILEQVLNLAYNLSGQARVIEPGYLVWQFFLYFGVIATWVAIGYVTAREYHRRAPGNLQSEIDEAIYGDLDFGDEF